MVGIEAVVVVAIVLVFLGLDHLLVHDGPGIVFLSFIHVLEIVEDPFVFHGFLLEYFQHRLGGLFVDRITIFGFRYVFPLSVEESLKVFIVDIFNIKPLNFKKALEFEGMIIPPVGEGFLVNT